MQIFWIRTESGEDFWGPYTDRSLADRVLKIACMAGYEDAEMAEAETDEYSREILAGLLPWRIVAEIEDGKLMKTIMLADLATRGPGGHRPRRGRRLREKRRRWST